MVGSICIYRRVILVAGCSRFRKLRAISRELTEELVSGIPGTINS